MRIAIHPCKGSFSDQWILYCEEHKLPYKLVNCYDNDIIAQLKDCDILMWHHHHTDYRDVMVAKRLLFSLDQAGKIVYPNFNTVWHFDDKLGQKYLFESIDVPIIPSYVFYDKISALTWAKKTDYPKVFKLRKGAGASHVKLVSSFHESMHYINKAFGKGFAQYDPIANLKERFSEEHIAVKDKVVGLLKGVIRLIRPTEFSSIMGNEKGYVYFQDFVPNNEYDIRLIVIGNKAYGMKRLNRKDDFRASGSGTFMYDPLPREVVELGFRTSEKLQVQSAAYDFIFDEQGEPVILEISYCYGTHGSNQCPGYWDSNLVWHEGPFNPFAWMMETALNLGEVPTV